MALDPEYTLPDDGFVGLIIPARTGIIYRAQVGGTCCQHPALEGWFWPMNWRTWESEQEAALCDWGLQTFRDNQDRSAIQAALAAWDLDQIFRAPTDDEAATQLGPYYHPDLMRRNPDRLLEYGEAWVPVTVRETPAPDPETGYIHMLNGDAPPSGMAGRCMILTYPNSD